MKTRKRKAYIRETGIYIFLVENKKLFCYALFWGVPFAVSCVLGWRLVHEGTVFCPGGPAAAYVGSFLLFLTKTAVLSVPPTVLAAFVMRGWKKRGREGGAVFGMRERGGTGAGDAAGKPERESGAALNSSAGRPAWQVWLCYSLLIFLCWLPVFFAYYPSVFAYDAEGQLYQVLAGDYSTHHPLLHTLFLGAFLRLGEALGSVSAGMAVHSLVQMAFMACAFGWALSFLYQRRISKWLRGLVFLFFALFPTNSVLALSTTKDVLFSALVLLYTLCLYRFLCGEDAARKKKEGALCVCLAVLMLLFRNNAVYAFLVSVPVVGIGLGKGFSRPHRGDDIQKAGSGAQIGKAKERKELNGMTARKGYLCMAALTFALYGISAFSLKTVTHAQNGSPREMLSVPLQQMARTRVKEEERIEQELRQELEKYIPSEWVFAAYNPHLADPVKNRAVIHDDPLGLIKTWVKLGLDHPGVYIDAFLDNSLGLWYLWDTSHAQVYGIGTESGFGYLSTDNRAMPAGYEVEEKSLLPELRAFMEKIVSDNAYSGLPLVRLLFAPALYWWMLYLGIVTALYRKKYRESLSVIFLAAYWLTLLLSPTALVRYAYPVMATAPVILPCLLDGRVKEKGESIQ